MELVVFCCIPYICDAFLVTSLCFNSRAKHACKDGSHIHVSHAQTPKKIEHGSRERSGSVPSPAGGNGTLMTFR